MLVTILAFVVVLGITITIHEFGHFAMAKLLKIRVMVFSVGFGPRLAGFTRGGTDYCISALPVGGYVKMAGETFDEDRKGAPDEFLSHPKWHRLLVAVAGPFMNVVLAVAILTSSYMQGVWIPRYHKEPAIVGPVNVDSAAYRAGLRTGDRVISLHGSAIITWEDLEIALATAPKDSLNMVIERGAGTYDLHIEAPKSGTVDPATLGFRFSLSRTIVAVVDPQSPAERAGLKEGDELIAVQGPGRSGRGYDQILNIISESKGVPLNFEIWRPAAARASGDNLQGRSTEAREAGTTLILSITPIEDQGRAVIGFKPEIPTDLEKFGLIGAIGQSVRRNFELSALTFRIVGRIFKGSASVRTIGGPLEIARISGSAARTGSARVFFGFLGLVSLQLGVFNLLPIPILDGGVITLLLIEALIRRDLSLGLKEKIVQVGFVFLILLMGFVVFNDLSKIVDFDKILR